MSKTISFGSVKPGEIFRIIRENRTVHTSVTREDRDGHKVRFHRELVRPTRVEKQVYEVPYYDHRTYAKLCGSLSVCLESGHDAILGLRDEVEVLSNVDKELEREGAYCADRE